MGNNCPVRVTPRPITDVSRVLGLWSLVPLGGLPGSSPFQVLSLLQLRGPYIWRGSLVCAESRPSGLMLGPPHSKSRPTASYADSHVPSRELLSESGFPSQTSGKPPAQHMCNPMESCAPWYGSGGTERGALSRCCPSGSAILTSADKMESCPLDVGPPQAPASPRRRVVPGQGPFHTFPAESSTATASSFVLAAANLTHVLLCVPVYP